MDKFTDQQNSAPKQLSAEPITEAQKQDQDPQKTPAKTKVSKKTKIRAATVLSIISALFIAATVVGVILMKEYFTDAEPIRKLVEQNYILGAAIMILVTALQVVVAFVPGELVESAAGFVFGWFWGAVFVLIGAVLGSVIAILLTRKFGLKLFKTFFPDTDLNSLPILNNPAQRSAMTFLLFLIPGTPKDMLTYVVGLTDMKIWQYLHLTSFARITSIVSSTIGGDALGNSQIMTAIYIFAGIAIVSLIGYVIYGKITNKKPSGK